MHPAKYKCIKKNLQTELFTCLSWYMMDKICDNWKGNGSDKDALNWYYFIY